MIPQSRLYKFFISKVKPLSSYLYENDVCKCQGNTYCFICWGAMETAFEAEYARLEKAGMEDYLEAKEFMWDFFKKRDEDIDDAPDDPDLTGW